MQEKDSQLASKSEDVNKLEEANSKLEEANADLLKKLTEYESVMKLTREKDENIKNLVNK